MEKVRPGMDKSQMLKEAKENAELIRFVKSLTKEEMIRIKQVREYNEIKVGTPTYKIAILCDAIRSQIRMLRAKITKRLYSIDNLTNNIARLETQLETGKITEILKSNMIMNSFEIKSLIQHNEWLRQGEVDAIPMALADLRALVGHKDVARNIIMDQDVFDKLVLDIEQRLKIKGYNMFGELDAYNI